MKKKISIILPNFNSQKYIKQTIQSILNQSFKLWELIIVDDCSNSETKDILKNYKKNKKIKIFYLNKNKGAAFCRNFAIKKAQSEYLAFIDSDDVWKKNKLKNQINFMKRNNFLFTYTNYETFGKKIKKIYNPPKLNYSNFIKNTSIATSTMMIKREEIKNIKFINSKICEDYYFKCKLLKKVKFAYCLKKILTKYRIRNESLQSSNIRNFYWIWKINKDYNNLNFFENFISLFFISLNSIKKYGGKNIFN